MENLPNEEFAPPALHSSSLVTEGRGVFCRCVSKLTQQLKDWFKYCLLCESTENV